MKRDFAADKVLEICDAADGAKDEMIQDSRQCEVDFSQFQCTAGDGPDCLTAPEITSIHNILRDTAAPISNISSWNYLGNTPPPWDLAVFGRGDWGAVPAAYTILNGWARTNLQQPDRDIIEQPLTEEEIETIIQEQARITGFDSANRWELDGFEEAGGKTIFYVGVGDPAFPHVAMENWFNIWTDRIGAERREQVGKLYQVPGWGHCGGGSGPDDGTDVMLRALIDWVEKGKEPQGLEMHRGTDRVDLLFPPIQSASGAAEAGAAGSVSTMRSRDFLVCPYPKMAVFDSTKANVAGAVYEAENWSCRPSPYVK